MLNLRGLLLFSKKNIERDGTFKVSSFEFVFFKKDFLELNKFRRICKMLRLLVPVTSVTSNLIQNFVLIITDQSVRCLGCRLDDSSSVLVKVWFFF
jgi:hypothetical protein